MPNIGNFPGRGLHTWAFKGEADKVVAPLGVDVGKASQMGTN